MKKKYNLALIPGSKSDDIIALSQQFSAIADQYFLSDQSLPHITLYQFYVNEAEIVPIWNHVCSVWSEPPLSITLSKFSCITFGNDIFWISLLPNDCKILHKYHSQMAVILQLPIKKTFDPHLTLINTKNKAYKKEAALIIDTYKTIADKFILCLGESDDIGQLTRVVYQIK